MRLQWIIKVGAAMLLTMAGATVRAEEKYSQINDIDYRTEGNEYALERCKLDVYYPETRENCPVVVWFHGGGLTGGNKAVPSQLKQSGYVVVAVNYRLLPKATIDECLDDCACSVAWVMDNIRNYGGSTDKVFLSGHSAGGYITAMLGLDRSWLQKYQINADSLAGLIPFSGQMITHFAHRDMNGIPNLQPTIDRYAPLFHVRNDCPPLVLITGDREMELYGRYEENAYLWRMMKLVGHQNTYLYEIDGHGHGPMCGPAYHILKQHISIALGEKPKF